MIIITFMSRLLGCDATVWQIGTKASEKPAAPSFSVTPKIVSFIRIAMRTSNLPSLTLSFPTCGQFVHIFGGHC